MTKKGQNLTEYVLLVVAVVIVLIVFLKPKGAYHEAVNSALEAATVNQLQKIANEIKF